MVVAALCICLSVIIVAGATVGYVALKDVERYYVVKSTSMQFGFASEDPYQSIETKYDEKGNVISEIFKFGDNTNQRSYQYDENGLIKSMSVKVDGEPERKLTFSHSQRSGLTVAESTPVRTDETDTNLTLEYIYNEDNQLISQTTYVHDNGRSYISNQSLYEYHENGTIKHRETKSGIVQSISGEVKTTSTETDYDEFGNIVQIIGRGNSDEILNETYREYRDSDSGRLQEECDYRYD